METWRPHRNLTGCEGGCREAGEGLFLRKCSDRTGSNGYKVKGEFSVGIRKKVFTVSVVRHWNRVTGKVVAAPILAVFKARLDKALGNLV